MSATHRTVSRAERIRNGDAPRRQPRPRARRQGTRAGVRAAALAEQR